MNTEKAIIEALLDRYERTQSYRAGQEPSRRIMLTLYGSGGEKTDFPAYDITDHDARIEVNAALESLAKKGLVSFGWLKGETGHIAEKVWLNYPNLDGAYAFAKRVPKSDEVESTLEQAREILAGLTTGWAREYFESLIQSGQSKRDFGHSLPQDAQERNDLFKSIKHVDNRPDDSEMVERALSMQLFSDSKRFETAVRPKLLSILRKHCDPDKLCENEEELLRQVGIVKYPEYFEFSGALSIETPQGLTDFAALPHGSSLCVADLAVGKVTIPSGTRQVISIENRANYIHYVSRLKKDSELVLYHAGQYSPARKKFFLAVAEAMPKECTWLHWGDIDFGGFAMLLRLRKEIDPNIAPYRMDSQELDRYMQYCGTINEAYATRLKSLAQEKELSDCQDCLEYMVGMRRRLEQEAMLLET